MPQQEVVSNNIISTIKKNQIIEEIVKTNPTIPACLLELIWGRVKGMDEKTLKQLRKGNKKIKNPIQRRQYEDGEVIKQSCVIQENAIPPVKEILLPKKIEEVGIEDGDETSSDA